LIIPPCAKDKESPPTEIPVKMKQIATHLFIFHLSQFYYRLIFHRINDSNFRACDFEQG